MTASDSKRNGLPGQGDLRLGELDVMILSDGMARTSLDQAIGIERQDASSLVGDTDEGVFYISVNNYVFARNGKIILIDAGTGGGIQPTLGKLPESLRSKGISPASVTHILLTHLHPDHANGLIAADGSALYPNAEIVLHEAEHRFWSTPGHSGESAKLQATRQRNLRNIAPYADRTILMTDGQDLLGCTPILAPGHTPGHTCWQIETGGKPMLAWGDLVHFSRIQISHPQVAVTYDMDAERARASRMRMLDMAATERLTVLGAHVDVPGIGHVAKAGSGFSFEPSG